MTEFKCKNCKYIGTRNNFSKPCPKCKGTIICHFNKKESEICGILLKNEVKLK